jgi:phosphatidylserine/phosphatidylglycerophosphate/cardiolipin synthase-like enzyme
MPDLTGNVVNIAGGGASGTWRFSPRNDPHRRLRLTSIRVQDAERPEAFELPLSQYADGEIVVRCQHVDDAWLYGAEVIVGGSMRVASWPKLIAALPERPTPDAALLSGLARAAYDAAVRPGTLTHSPCPRGLMLTHNNRLRTVLVNGPKIFSAFRDEIAKARHVVCAAFYKWDHASGAANMIEEGIRLAAAASPIRLTVHLLVSDLKIDANRSINELWDSVRETDLSDKVTFRLATYPHYLFGSLHDKIISVDGRTLLITGANPETYHDHPETCWRDTGFVIDGPACLAANSSFEDSWERHAKHWECKQRSGSFDCQGVDFGPQRRTPLPPVPPWEPNGVSMIALGKTAGSIGAANKDNPQDAAFLTLIEKAARTINVVTPNVNVERLEQALLKAAGRGVRVRLVTGKGFNDWGEDFQGRTNEEVAASVKRAIQGLAPSARGNFEFHWNTTDDGRVTDGNVDRACHTKFLSADEQVAVIGSGNLDIQSWDWSREFNVLIDSRPETERLNREIFDLHWRHSKPA